MKPGCDEFFAGYLRHPRLLERSLTQSEISRKNHLFSSIDIPSACFCGEIAEIDQKNLEKALFLWRLQGRSMTWVKTQEYADNTCPWEDGRANCHERQSVESAETEASSVAAEQQCPMHFHIFCKFWLLKKIQSHESHTSHMSSCHFQFCIQ